MWLLDNLLHKTHALPGAVLRQSLVDVLHNRESDGGDIRVLSVVCVGDVDGLMVSEGDECDIRVCMR